MPFCPNCGKEITSNAKFCRMCGKKLTTSEAASPSPPARESIYSRTIQLGSKKEPSTPVPPPSPPSKPAIDVEPITEEIIDILYSRTRVKTVEKDRQKLVEEFSDIEKKMEIGLLASDEAMSKIKEIKVKMAKIKEEKTGLKIGKIQAEKDLEAYVKAVNKRKKLEEMKTAGKISSESVYSKLYGEATSAIDKLKESLSAEKLKMEHWSLDMDSDVSEIKESIESTKVRAELGEITKEEAKDEIYKMKRELAKKEVVSRELKSLINKIEF
ncbi:MAG: zinc-ribbon domain-containing protein [Candidatus Hodarchaeales archaeon]